MAGRWAAHNELPARKLDLRTEGGNLWSDGAGTLVMSDHIYVRNPDLSPDEIERRLRETLAFDRLILVPHLVMEETGHVDLLIKLADARTVLVSAPVGMNAARLEEAAAIFQRETNARGEPYRVFTLPSPPFYLNWGLFPVWRSYTNALTVNGRVLVPIFGVHTDEAALAVYRDAMPGHEIIGIDCSATANGGGAVHCLTKEIPRARA
jgi:agmatine deiminase